MNARRNNSHTLELLSGLSRGQRLQLGFEVVASVGLPHFRESPFFGIGSKPDLALSAIALDLLTWLESDHFQYPESSSDFYLSSRLSLSG